MAKYKVGDTVRIRSDLTANKRYHMEDRDKNNYEYCAGTMFSYAGKFVTIAAIKSDECGYSITDSAFTWTDEMFEDTRPAPELIIKATLHRSNGKIVTFNTVIESSGDYQDLGDAASHAIENFIISEASKLDKPYLASSYGNYFYGFLGEETVYKDAVGRPLCVGDTVEIFDSTAELLGESPVVCTKEDGAFIMGICGPCSPVTGATRGFKLIKKRSYEEIPNDDVISDIRYYKS